MLYLIFEYLCMFYQVLWNLFNNFYFRRRPVDEFDEYFKRSVSSHRLLEDYYDETPRFLLEMPSEESSRRPSKCSMRSGSTGDYSYFAIQGKIVLFSQLWTNHSRWQSIHWQHNWDIKHSWPQPLAQPCPHSPSSRLKASE